MALAAYIVTYLNALEQKHGHTTVNLSGDTGYVRDSVYPGHKLTSGKPNSYASKYDGAELFSVSDIAAFQAAVDENPGLIDRQVASEMAKARKEGWPMDAIIHSIVLGNMSTGLNIFCHGI
jgi:hypothetical protein